MTNNEPDYKEDLYFENNKIQTTGIDDTKTQANLTEQWKKGELSEGHYYVKDGENMIAEYLDGYFYNNGEPMTSFSSGVKEVLAPVPSYEEWKETYNCMLENEVLRLKNAQLKEQINKCYLDAINRGTANTVKAVKEFGMPERIKELVEQNAQLKDLLKRVNEHFKWVDKDDPFYVEDELWDDIKKVLEKNNGN